MRRIGAVPRGEGRRKAIEAQRKSNENRILNASCRLPASLPTVVVVTCQTDVVDSAGPQGPGIPGLSPCRADRSGQAAVNQIRAYQLVRLFRRRWIPFTWLGPPRFREKRGRDLLALEKLFERRSRMRTVEE